MKKIAVVVAFALGTMGVLAIGAAPAGAAFSAYALGDLSLQNGWDGGAGGGAFTPNTADSNVVTNTDALTGTQSWRFSGGSSSTGVGSPFTPNVATVGALNAIAAGSAITPAGNESVVTFAFKAVVPGDGSAINMFEGSNGRDDRTGASIYLQNDTVNGNPAATVSLSNFSSTNNAPTCDTAQVNLGSVSVGAWHTVEMTTTYQDLTVNDPSTYGSTVYVFDKGTVGEQTTTMQSFSHALRDCNGDDYVPGGSLKFANSFNDYPTHSGFYIDDVSMTVTNTVSTNVVGTFATSFEATPCTTVCYVAPGGSGDESGRDAANAMATIQAAINAVSVGGTVNVAAGTYAENVTIGKQLDLVGDSSTTTIIDPSADGPAITITAGGSSAADADRLKIRQLKATGATTAGSDAQGIAFTGASSIDFVTIDSVRSTNNAGDGVAFDNTGAMSDIVFNNDTFSNNGTGTAGDGMRISSGPTIDGLTITNSHLDNNAAVGWETFIDPAATNASDTHVENVLAEDTTFDANASQGVYAERLQEAIFRRVSAVSNGTTTDVAFASPTGININLMFQTYVNITIEDSTITGNGNTGTPQATNSSGIAVKARGTGTDGAPFDANPATLAGLTITGNTVTGNVGAGIRLGELGVNNVGPTSVQVHENDITGHTTGTAPFGFENVSTTTADGTCNWWGAADGPSGSGPGSGDAVSSGITFSPFQLYSTARCPPTVPDAPIDALAAVGNNSLSVGFTTPNDGGLPITVYTATCASSNPTLHPTRTGTAANSPVVVSLLDNLVLYVCWVKATNSLGDSVNSNFTFGTPANLPGAPTGVMAFAGDARATVGWVAPASDGGSPITEYTVTASPGGATCSWSSGPLMCDVTGLANGTDYAFTVTASNVPGSDGPASSVSNTVTPLTWAGHFQPLVPARILDTRNGNGHTGAAGPAQSFDVQVTGRGGVPASGVAAVVMNVTATGATAPSFLTIWPQGSARPAASNLNFIAGQTRPNLVTVKVGPDGQVSFFNGAGSAHVIADVQGWYSDATVVGGSRLNPVVPARILDTRTTNGGHLALVGPGESFNLQVTGRGGVPASGVAAVVMNVTVTNPTASSFLTIWPEGAARPTTSNLNFLANQTVPNLVVVKVGPDGKVSIFNGAGSTNVVADVFGWFSSPGP